MSNAGANAAAFYREVARTGRVWTIRDEGGFPAPRGDAARSMPFWSSESRVKRIISKVPAYRAFSPVALELDAFLERWIPGLTRDGLKVGVNWSGAGARGYDIEPLQVAENIRANMPPASNWQLDRTLENEVPKRSLSGSVGQLEV